MHFSRKQLWAMAFFAGAALLAIVVCLAVPPWKRETLGVPSPRPLPAPSAPDTRDAE